MTKNNTQRHKDKDIAYELLELGKLIEPVIKELFPSGKKEDYLTGAVWHHMGTGGKRIRPALCLLLCKELGGETEDAVYFAAGVEILHNMFLIHDDLEDGDEIRRDAPAVWSRYGAANAINIGDYMLGRAYSSVLKSPVAPPVKCRLLETFTSTFEKTCKGQALDLNWRGIPDMSIDKYMEIVQWKTADYLVLGMKGGAMIAGASGEILESIKRLGCFIGPAFQIRDDIIDLTLGKGRGGELGNDIKEGKPSILFAHALNSASEADRAVLLETVRCERERTCPESVERVIGLYKKYGSLDFAQEKADELTSKAYGVVDEIPVTNKDIFRRIVQHMSERTR